MAGFPDPRVGIWSTVVALNRSMAAIIEIFLVENQLVGRSESPACDESSHTLPVCWDRISKAMTFSKCVSRAV